MLLYSIYLQRQVRQLTHNFTSHNDAQLETASKKCVRHAGSQNGCYTVSADTSMRQAMANLCYK